MYRRKGDDEHVSSFRDIFFLSYYIKEHAKPLTQTPEIFPFKEFFFQAF